MLSSFLHYFTDPVLRAPTLACMLMSLAAAMIGVVAFLRKQSLIGEALSHASFPGVILGVMISGTFFSTEDAWVALPLITILGAFIAAFLGLITIQTLEKVGRIRSDSALCFVLSAFFGIGITLSSQVQFTHSTLYKQSLSYLYGQAATLIDVHIYLYGSLALIVATIIFLFYKELKVMIFDQEYAKSLGIRVPLIQSFLFAVMVLAIVIGIRSVGVVLMSAMLIAPAVAARQFTHRLWVMIVLAGFFGLLSGFFGVFFSVELSRYFAESTPPSRLSFPTGPMIVLTATTFCLFALLFAPERGLIFRLFRLFYFRYQCLCENVLKAMWRKDPKESYSIIELKELLTVSPFFLFFVLLRLWRNGWVRRVKGKKYRLSRDGTHRAARIVRLHRLWELYLSDYLGIGVEKVHRSAEEMEHILTPEIETELTLLLNDPQYDPHHQPIPPQRRG